MLIGQQIASLPYSLFATHYWLPGFSLFVAGLPSAILREQLPAHRIEPGLPIVAERIVNRVPDGLVVDATASTVARMPQGKPKSGFPHEPVRPRLPLDHRFGMLRLGVRVVVEAVTMR